MKKLSKFLEDSQNKAPMRINGFAILKPGFLSYEEPFCNMLQNNGWNIIEKKRCKLTPDQAAKLYVNLNEKPFYNDLCQYMSSDNCLCCRCSKDCEDPIGDMKTLKDKVRDQWGIDDMRNAIKFLLARHKIAMAIGDKSYAEEVKKKALVWRDKMDADTKAGSSH